MTSLLHNKLIAIVGGGPGGLTLARILQMHGVHVKVYERDQSPEVRVQGATLDLHDESGLKALRAAGLIEEFKANYRPGADRMRVTNKKATILYDDAINDDERLSRPEIDRGPLRDILLNALKPGTVVWDSQFIALKQLEDQVELEFKNGTRILADLVIAADGGNSKIRPYLTPVQPFFTGVTAIEGMVYNSARNTPKIHALLNGGKIFALDDAKTIIVSSKGDGSLIFYPGFKTSESWIKESGIDFGNREQVLAWFKKEFIEWDEVWIELFEHANLPLTPRPQYCMPLNQIWETHHSITMLGDAAHLMPPYAGEGVNMAMLDALELAECLLSDTFTDVKTAINKYEKQMSERVSEIAKMTLNQTDSMHSADGLENLLSLFKSFK